MGSIPFCQFHSIPLNSIWSIPIRVPTWNAYSEKFIFHVGLSWKKYFCIKKLNGKLICGFNLILPVLNIEIPK